MVEFWQAGGFVMWLVLLLGGATLVTAVLFARRADERRLVLMRTLSLATVFSIVTGVCTNIGTVMYTVPQNPKFLAEPHLERIVMIGIGESLAPAILGGTLLTLAWLVASVGVRRLALHLAAEPA